MKATIDPEGRIALDHGMQAFLGVQPGDDVVVEPRGSELVVRAATGKTGLCYDGAVLVHRGACRLDTDSVSDTRDERMDQLALGPPK